MRISAFGKVFLAGIFAAASASLWAQSPSAPLEAPAFFDISVTYAVERAQIAPGICGCFWLKGGGADVALTFWKGFGVAASLTGAHVSSYSPGLDIDKIAYMGGPRYTRTAWTRLQIFGEALFGGVHAFDGAFPSGASLAATANSFALQAGGGINLFFSRNIGVRLLQADYVRTGLPNNYSQSQNDLRVAFGVDYHFGSASPVR
jgi:outer membrane immunogenic protein